VQRGAQRLGGEERLPASGHEFVRAAGRVLSEALQDIDPIVVPVDVVSSAGDDQALQDADVPGTECGPAEPPVLSTPGDRPQGSLERMRIDRHVRVGEEPLQAEAAVAGLSPGLGQRMAR